MRNTGASSTVTVDDLVRATLPDVILTIEAMRVEQKRVGVRCSTCAEPVARPEGTSYNAGRLLVRWHAALARCWLGGSSSLDADVRDF